MAKVTMGQLYELCQQVRCGRIPAWKVFLLFGIDEEAESPLLEALSGLVNAVIGASGESPRVTREKLQALLDGKDEPVFIFKFLSDDCGKAGVDYGRSLAQMIADGCYYVVDPNITIENFPIAGEGEAERDFVYASPWFESEGGDILQSSDMADVVSFEDILAKMEHCGFQPAKVEDALAFAAKFPDEQRMQRILVVGSPWVDSDGQRHFICLDSSGGFERSLKLVPDSGLLDMSIKILAVRKDAA